MLRLLIIGIFAALVAGCVYIAYATGTSGNMQSAWFFSAFAFFFVVPLCIAFLKLLAEKNYKFKQIYEKISGPEQKGVRFVPHWITMLIILIFGILASIAIIRIVF